MHLPRPLRIVTRITLWLCVVCTVLFISLLAYARYGYSLRPNQAVSISTAPEGDPDIQPVFSRCDSIKCACSCNDPYDPRTVIDSGVYAGLCLNTCVIRSVRALDAATAAQHGYFPQAQQHPELIYCVNVYHQRDSADTAAFYAAAIDPGAVRDVIFQMEFAGGVQAHAQMRLRFDPDRPVILVPQEHDRERIEQYVTDLYYSVEAIGPPGIPYKGDYGLRKVYFQRYRLTSQFVRAQVMIRTLQRPVLQYRLDLDAPECVAVLREAIGHGTQADPGELYHTTRNNCSMAIFGVIDRALRYPWFRHPLIRVTDNTLFMPTRLPHHLRYRGLAGKGDGGFQLPNLETELGWEAFVAAAVHARE